ncbi:MAG: hypothetical protein OEV37_00625 [Candidatus Berkelbacteria bacterium]|nr:hypothetical protein [Candidatus Berkelbacteria bacterium]
MRKARQCTHCHCEVPLGYMMFSANPGKGNLCAACEGRLHRGGTIICAKCGATDGCFADDPTDPAKPGDRRKICKVCAESHFAGRNTALYGCIQPAQAEDEGVRRVRAGHFLLFIPPGFKVNGQMPRAGQHLRFRPGPGIQQTVEEPELVRY